MKNNTQKDSGRNDTAQKIQSQPQQKKSLEKEFTAKSTQIPEAGQQTEYPRQEYSNQSQDRQDQQDQ